MALLQHQRKKHTHVHKQEHTHQITKQLSQWRTQKMPQQISNTANRYFFQHKNVFKILTFKALEKCSAKRNKTLFQSRHSHIWKYKLRDKFDTKYIKTHLSIGSSI